MKKYDLNDVEMMISENLSQHITIRELSYIFDISESKLKSDFKKRFGIPLYQYLRRKRMERAAEMIAETDMKILEISCCLGYDNGSKFARAFCDVIGVTPSEYRRKNADVPAEKTNEI